MSNTNTSSSVKLKIALRMSLCAYYFYCLFFKVKNAFALISLGYSLYT